MSVAKREPGLTAGLQGVLSSAARRDAAELTHASSAGKQGSFVRRAKTPPDSLTQSPVKEGQGAPEGELQAVLYVEGNLRSWSVLQLSACERE